MHATVRRIAIVLALAILFNQSAYIASAQTPDAQTAVQPLNAPVPAQIAEAHTIFLSNAGVDFDFPAGETYAYNQVYAALQTWGHYQLVPSPKQADLIFQLRGIAPAITSDDYHGDADSIPVFQLTILDAKTNTTLWIIISPADATGNAKARARWFSIAVTNLVSRIKVLASEPLSANETADLTTVPKRHGLRNTLILIGAGAVLGVALDLVAKHKFQNSLLN